MVFFQNDRRLIVNRNARNRNVPEFGNSTTIAIANSILRRTPINNSNNSIGSPNVYSESDDTDSTLSGDEVRIQAGNLDVNNQFRINLLTNAPQLPRLNTPVNDLISPSVPVSEFEELEVSTPETPRRLR